MSAIETERHVVSTIVAMKPSYSTSFLVGAVGGLVVAVATLLFVASLGGISYLNPSIETGSVDPVFSVPASSLWMMTLVAGFGGGAVISAITFGVARVIDPAAKPLASPIVILVGATVGATIAIAVMLLGAGILGTVADGMATVTVVEMVVLAAIIGLSGGAFVAWFSYVLARPPVYEADPDLLTA
jgi:hypothetical protein